ncbi:helix-turn-helix domain-containing protein [Paenibacillus sp. SYP-B4298]|uniref:helix-turn-helix domain-containing protein n=1 Tax=Paenibacillus sp. SYP-B4298 TaxID=2996034 RepID=UPI0022DE05DA|nr:helix-turn-helix transcriptional regulator [Paenibacillus sp. SYP-B4298]
MTQKQLSELTGIRPAAISEICNNQRTSINREHIEKIAHCLDIQDIRDLIRLEK